jgi:hypothetical protein
MLQAPGILLTNCYFTPKEPPAAFKHLQIAFLSSTVLTVLARSCSPVQQSGVGFGALPVAKPRQAAAFESTVLHGTAAPFMLAMQC